MPAFDYQCQLTSRPSCMEHLPAFAWNSCPFCVEYSIPLVERFYGLNSPEMASELNNLGCSELRQNKLDSAEPHILQAIGILEKTLGKSSTPYGLAALNMAEIYELRQNPAQSIVWYRRAISSFDETLGSKNSLSQKIAERCKTLKMSRQANSRL